MRLSFLILTFTCIWVSSFAQSHPVVYEDGRITNEKFVHDSISSEYMSLLPSSEKFAESPRLDRNKKPCALIQVVTANDSTLQFLGNIVGDIEYNEGMYRLYMTEGSHLLRIIKDGSPIDIDLYLIGDKKINTIEGGHAYSLCGLDNEKDLIIRPYSEKVRPSQSHIVRKIARDIINLISSCNVDILKSTLPDYSFAENYSLNQLYDLMESCKNNSECDLIVRLESAMIHGAKPNVWGVTFRVSDNDRHSGFLFTLLDFNDPAKLQLQAVTYQTEEDVKKNDGIVIDLDCIFYP